MSWQKKLRAPSRLTFFLFLISWFTNHIRGKSVLVISGGYAQREESSLTWTVNDLEDAVEDHNEDCDKFGFIPCRIHPNDKNLPYDKKNQKVLFHKPDKENIVVINVGAYFGHNEIFLEVLRLVLSSSMVVFLYSLRKTTYELFNFIYLPIVTILHNQHSIFGVILN